MTSYTVFDFKIVLRTGQTGCQGTRQKSKFLSPTKPRNNFLSSAQVVKNIQITFYPSNIVQRQNLFSTLNFVLCCSVLYCQVLIFYLYI
jgi:hypothetical protein